MRKTISLDFDGVLHNYEDGWTGYVPSGDPIPGARVFVEWCLEQGYEVIISSCRAYTMIGRDGIRHWLDAHGFPIVSVTCEKPHAGWYVDDRGIRFNGDFEAVKEAMSLPVWFAQKPEPKFEE